MKSVKINRRSPFSFDFQRPLISMVACLKLIYNLERERFSFSSLYFRSGNFTSSVEKRFFYIKAHLGSFIKEVRVPISGVKNDSFSENLACVPNERHLSWPKLHAKPPGKWPQNTPTTSRILLRILQFFIK